MTIWTGSKWIPGNRLFKLRVGRDAEANKKNIYWYTSFKAKKYESTDRLVRQLSRKCSRKC